MSSSVRYFNIFVTIASGTCRLAGIPSLVTNDIGGLGPNVRGLVRGVDIAINDATRPGDSISFRRLLFKLRRVFAPDGAVLTSDRVGEGIRRLAKIGT